MRRNKWLSIVGIVILLFTFIQPVTPSANSTRVLEDESIYDLLIDRFDNGSFANDIDVSVADQLLYSGGDFIGVSNRLPYITEMNFTLISVGNVFPSNLYDGSEVTDYEAFEEHFGTETDFIHMITRAHEEDFKIVTDFPMNQVSSEHVWAQDNTLAFEPLTDKTIQWDYSDAAVQEQIKETIVNYVSTYELDGIRLSYIDGVPAPYLDEIIEAVKAVNPELYVFSTTPSEAAFDLAPNLEKMNILRESFVQFDADITGLAVFNDKNEQDLIQFDELIGPRFTYDIVELRMFPPTRWKMASTALFTLPGIPIMPYGTEIAVNGKDAPESHPIANFHTDMELQEYIGDLNKLRNESEALRNGEFEILHDEDGFFVYKRSSDEETWIIALNNSSATASFALDEELIGKDMRLRGLLDQDMIKQSKDDKYRIVANREIAEIYFVEEDPGFNTAYLVASILIYVFFLSFLYLLFKKRRK